MITSIIKKYNFFITYNRLFNSINNIYLFRLLLSNTLNTNCIHNSFLLFIQPSQLNYNQNKQTYIFINNKLSRRNPAKIIYALCFLFLEGAYFDS